MKTALELVLFYGQTKKNILQTQWNHLDFETGVWVIPKKVKGESSIDVLPLLDYGSILFKRLPKVSKWVFPSSRQNNHFSEASIDQAIRYIRLSTNISDLTISNIRITIASRMVDAGFEPSAVKEILGFRSTKEFFPIWKNSSPNQFNNRADRQMDIFHMSYQESLLNRLDSSFKKQVFKKHKEDNCKVNTYRWWHNHLLKVLLNFSNDKFIGVERLIKN